MLPSESPELQILFDNKVENKIVSLVEEYKNSHSEKYFGSNNMWRFLNRKLFESYRICIDTRSFFTKMKKDVIKNVEMYEDQEKAADVLFRLVKNYLPIFDMMPPRTVLINDIINRDKRSLRSRNPKDKISYRFNQISIPLTDCCKSATVLKKKDQKENYKTKFSNDSASGDDAKKGIKIDANKPSCSVPGVSDVRALQKDQIKDANFHNKKIKRMKTNHSNSNFNKMRNSESGSVAATIDTCGAHVSRGSAPKNIYNASGSKTVAVQPYSSSITPSTSMPSSSFERDQTYSSITMTNSRNANQSSYVAPSSFFPASFYQNFNFVRGRGAPRSLDDIPPEWFQNMYNDQKASAMLNLRELFQMERKYMDIECRKLKALERISETLMRKP